GGGSLGCKKIVAHFPIFGVCPSWLDCPDARLLSRSRFIDALILLLHGIVRNCRRHDVRWHIGGLNFGFDRQCISVARELPLLYGVKANRRAARTRRWSN